MQRKGNGKMVRCEDIQEILSAPPNALLTIGSMVICGILLLLFFGCFFFNYPDTITCSVTITKNEPPVWIVTNTSGRIQELFVRDHQPVKNGDIIGVIENTATTKDVMILDSILNLCFINYDIILRFNCDNLRLGNINNSYLDLVRAILLYRNYIKNNFYNQHIRAEEALLKTYTDSIDSIKKQFRLSNNNSLSSIMIQKAQIMSSISDLKLQQDKDMQQIKKDLQTACINVKTAIQEWKLKYLIQSPVSGIVSYNKLWRNQKTVNIGDKPFYITKDIKESTIGIAKIPIANSGKVEVSQKIIIRLDSYPYLEYGFLEGIIVSIDKMPEEDSYIATFTIGDEGITSYGKKIRITNALTGTGEIIIGKHSVAERFFAPLKYLLYRNNIN